MPISLKKVEPEPPKVKVKKVKPVKEPREKHRRTLEDYYIERIYGSDLFDHFKSKDKEVNITFTLLSLDLIKISNCGRYGFKHIKKINESERWELYHYFKPIKWTKDLNIEAVVHKDTDYEMFTFSCINSGCKAAIKEMENKVVELVREFYKSEENKALIEDTKNVINIIEAKAYEQEYKEHERESIIERQQSLEFEDESKHEEIKSEETLSLQEVKNENGDSVQSKENREATKFSFRKVN